MTISYYMPAGAGADPYDFELVIAEIMSVQPYCVGASRKDLERAAAQMANACLIASAPDLLAALCDLHDAVNSGGYPHVAMNAARAAIKLAKGETP
jgi:hypothetical protein